MWSPAGTPAGETSRASAPATAPLPSHTSAEAAWPGRGERGEIAEPATPPPLAIYLILVNVALQASSDGSHLAT